MDESLRDELVREIRDFLESQWPRAADGAVAITDRTADLVETKVRAREEFLRKDR